MPQTIAPLLVFYLLSCATSALIAGYCWRRKEVVGAQEYAVVSLSQALWTLGYILELVSPSLAGKIFWDNAQFIASAAWVMAFLGFALRYTERRLPSRSVVMTLLTAPFAALVILAYTDPLHGLIRLSPRLVPGQPYDALMYGFTAVIWGTAIYSYALYIGSILLLLHQWRTSALYQLQVGLLIAGSLIPIVGSALTIWLLADSPVRDMSPFTFVASSALVAWALFRFRLFDLVPVARDIVVESIADAVLVLDLQGRLVDLNPAARSLLDMPRAGLGRDALPEPWRLRLAEAQGGEGAAAREVELPTLKGPRQLELRVQPVLSQRGAHRGYVAVVRDITERKAVEAELHTYRAHLEGLVRARTADLQAANDQLQQEVARRRQLEAQMISGQRLEALGRMASGIAHDFNNVLTVVHGTAELLVAGRGRAERDEPELRAILQATTQGATLTRQLLAFSRGQALTLAAVDVAAVVGEFAPILRRMAGPQVELLLDLQAGATTVLADVGQLQQVLMNLVINARDAMPAGGRVRIGASPSSASVVGGAQAPRVRLTVADEGAGMDEPTRQRLFEPFFTTKEPGRGTGLGLSVVYGIITQLGGTIEVESAPGRGAAFTIELPSVECSPLLAGAQR